TVLIFGMIDPTSWLLYAVGLQGRSLAIALVIAPLAISAYFIGLPYGPKGVAIAFSTAMTLWVIPHLIWCLHGTAISLFDLLLATSRPFFSGIVAAAVAFVVHVQLGQWGLPLVRLILEGGVMLSIYCLILLFVMGQKEFYLDLVATLRKPSLPDATA